VIFERHNWEDSRLRCRRLHPKAHLVVFDDAAENTAILNHILTLDSKQSIFFIRMTARHDVISDAT